MRKLFVLAAALALATVAAGSALGNRPAATTLTGPCAKQNLKLVKDGKLTVGTDNPAFPPWFDGNERKSSGFETSDPYSGKGYESAVAYEVAKRLGFAHGEVTWKAVPFNRSYAPGKKPFDFYLAQVSYKPVRAKAVTFSSSYYDVQQAVVGIKGKPITKVTTVAGLKPFKLGVQIGTTSYDYIVKYIKPSKQVSVYDTNNDAVTALKNGQIDGLVVDYPSTGYITGVQVPKSTVVGRLPNQGVQEHFGLVFAKGNPLAGCVDKALAAMRTDGTLKRYEVRWLAKAGGAPQLK